LLTAPWDGIAPTPRPAGFDPANPASPGYNWDTVDAAVRSAAARGLQVVLGTNQAPRWAEGPNRPSQAKAPFGTWKPDPGKLKQFARALARRYSGHFSSAGGTLPRVRYFQLWAEPNLNVYLNPQWKKRRPVSALHYRKMLNAFYSGIKSVSKGDKVLTAGTAPYGDLPGGARVPPATFWQTLLCLRGHALRKVHCADPAHFDIAAHNPINVGAPTRHALNSKDISTPDLGRLTRILRKAAHTGRSKPAGHKPLWATEIWWDSKPPDPRGIPERRHARWLEQALYILWKQGAKRVVWFEIRDAPAAGSFAATAQSGLFFHDGKPKLAYRAYRFPFVGDRIGRRTVRVWGMAPSRGRVLIQRRHGGSWGTVKRLTAGRDRVFAGKLGLRGHAKLRARAGGETSLVWAQS
jgi:hypothetical protein